jgi:phage I-like protein
MIAAREYKYISPTIDPTIKDNKTGEAQGWTLTSAALTNQPVLQGMPALVLSEAGWQQDRGDAAKEKDVKKIILADRAARTVRLVAEDGTESTMAVEGLEAPPTVLRLSDVRRDAKSQEYDFAALDCGEGVLVAGEVFRAQQAQMALSEAVKAGKILPAQRAAYEKMALSDLVGFRELVASMKPQVELQTRGTGATEGSAADPAVEIDAKVKAKIVASEGKRDYATALNAVLRENRELSEAYKASMGGRK